jgi:hypothetical protein
MCLSWHVKGTCNARCNSPEDHRVHSVAEHATLVDWCQKNYSMEAWRGGGSTPSLKRPLTPPTIASLPSDDSRYRPTKQPKAWGYMPDGLGKQVKNDCLLLQNHSFEELFRLRQGRGDLTSLRKHIIPHILYWSSMPNGVHPLASKQPHGPVAEKTLPSPGILISPLMTSKTFSARNSLTWCASTHGWSFIRKWQHAVQLVSN